ncbi:hypothetical protein F4054_05435 [Candidatus Poribacteria bacterium]|nr:hypothetical protein [Candidatus Poribacteria bacterium]MYK21688.1 hypothetical protein [Candidatus Poribacteria bacterium]
MKEQNRNVRITYPDSRDRTLEIDFVQGTTIELFLPFDLLQYYAKDGKVEINQNLFALPGYRNYLRTKVMEITLSDDESSNRVFRQGPSDKEDFF